MKREGDREDRFLESRNVMVGVRRTSVRLEHEIWRALDEICQREDVSLHALCKGIDSQRGPIGRSSAMRVLAIGYFHAAATESGHKEAGHGPLPRAGADTVDNPGRATRMLNALRTERSRAAKAPRSQAR